MARFWKGKFSKNNSFSFSVYFTRPNPCPAGRQARAGDGCIQKKIQRINLKLAIQGCSRKWNYIPDVAHSGNE